MAPVNWDLALILALLAGVAFAVRSGRLPADLASFVALAVLLVAGRLEPAELFSGFSSPPFLAILALSMVTTALIRTGTAAVAGRALRQRLRGRGEGATIAGIALGGAAVGAVLGPQLSTAVLMPAAASIAGDAGRSQSRLLLPLAIGSILGATATGFGTSANVVAATVGIGDGEPVATFAFIPFAALALAAAILFLATLGRRTLPTAGSVTGADQAEDLARVYRLHEHVFSILVPAGSPLVGKTLGESELGSLDIQVLSVQRGDGAREKASPDTVVLEGDVLFLRGRLEDLRSLMRVRGVDVRETRASDLPRPAPGVSAARARLIAGSTMVGKTLRDLRFREHFGVIVVGIERAGKILRAHLSDARLETGDEVLVLGTLENLERFDHFPQWKIVDSGLGAIQSIQDHLFLMKVHEGSSLAGVSLGESRVGELVGLTVGGIIRDGQLQLAAGPDERIRAGDGLLVTGEPWRIVKLLEMGRVLADEAARDDRDLVAEDDRMAEICVAPRSGAAGHDVAELSFRERYGLEVLGIWRGGRAVEAALSRFVLRLGDALLVQGAPDRVRALADDADFVVLDSSAHPTRDRRRSAVALLGIGVLIVLAATGFQPLHVAAFAAAVVAVLGGAVRMEGAYRGTEWQTAFVVAAFVPLAIVAERVGLIDGVAEWMIGVTADLGPHGAIAGVAILAMVLAQAIDGAPAMLLALPVADRVADAAAVAPQALVLAAALAASSGILVRSRHPALVLVTGAGGYRGPDFLKVGLPVTAVVLLVATFVVPWAVGP